MIQNIRFGNPTLSQKYNQHRIYKSQSDLVRRVHKIYIFSKLSIE